MDRNKPNKIEELREATRQANEVLKDMKAERKAFKELIDSIKPDTLKFIETKITEELDDMTTAMKDGIDKSVQRVFDRFDQIENLLLGGGSATRPPLEDLTEAYVKRKKEEHAARKAPKFL